MGEIDIFGREKDSFGFVINEDYVCPCHKIPVKYRNINGIESVMKCQITKMSVHGQYPMEQK